MHPFLYTRPSGKRGRRRVRPASVPKLDLTKMPRGSARAQLGWGTCDLFALEGEANDLSK